jgi:hypothetical protein
MSKKTFRTKEQILADQAQARATQSLSVVAEFQAVVEELRSRGMSDIDVHSLVNMIFQGWLVAGQPTKEYLDLAVQAVEARNQNSEPSIIIDTSGKGIM